MGGGTYSTEKRMLRSSFLGYKTKSIGELFTSRSIQNGMNPNGISIRESCDSEEHPNSLPIIIALDVTGSMGNVPHHLVKEGLPLIMDKILKSGFSDPQILFLAIGDHECDRSPLQVGQFESNDEMLDKWLTDVYLEGGGGGNDGESYGLAWYFAAKHTSIDSMNKRNQKGMLFTIGDEPNLKHYPASAIKGIMGDGQYSDMTDKQLYELACKNYNVFHIHVSETGAGKHQSTVNEWKELLKDNLLMAQRHQDIANIIAIEVINEISKNKTETPVKSETSTQTENKTKIML